MIASVVVNEEIEEEEIEKLKEGDILETTFAQFSESAAEIYEPLINERDKFMAANLLKATKGENKRVQAVDGAGHLKGLKQHLEDGLSN